MTLRRTVDVVSLLAIVSSTAYVAAVYPHLPAIIPTHFDAAGHVNGMGPKSTLWLLPALSAGAYVLLTVVALVPARYYNYPVRVTDANRERLYALAPAMLMWAKLLTVSLFAALSYAVVRGALYRNFSDLWIVYACLAGLLAMLVYYIARMIAAR